MQILLPETEIFKSDADRGEALFFVHEFLTRIAATRGSPSPHRIAIAPLMGGRNAAYVLKVTPLPAASRQKPVVVKIVSHEKGRQEKSAYDEFVRPAVPLHFRPELFGFMGSENYSALCYAYIGGRCADPNTISSQLQNRNLGPIDVFLDDIFSKMGNTWYHKDMLQHEEGISGYYIDRYFPDHDRLIENSATLARLSEEYFGLPQSNGLCALDGCSIAPSFEALFRTGRSHRYSSCILHGDLNSDNILIGSDQASTILIDFQKTGRGHVYGDLVALESSIRINFPGGMPFDHIWRQERRVASGLRPISQDAYVAAIQKVRIAAFNHFGDFEDDWTYHFAVAATGLRLMQATDLSDAARARITAAALWAAMALAETSAA